ncbi:hypothetical protein E2C01_035024 [Portunus trituberculatus]|uniref:Uncharacterized protein n=1 Tax=Portunus trituberculatus TaxID=210409 RepID=A0A5B7F8L7_PORTR|nr:hypothetical protein [Portunus trituberculatus]
MPPDKHEHNMTRLFFPEFTPTHSRHSSKTGSTNVTASYPMPPPNSLQDMSGHMAFPTPPQQDIEEYYSDELE